MSQVLQLSLSEEALPGLRLHLCITGIVGVRPNESPAVEPKVSEEAVLTELDILFPFLTHDVFRLE